MTTVEKLSFISTIGSYAIANYRKEKILPSIIIAQAILESGWGISSELSTNYNNYFGLKWYNDDVCRGYKSVQYGTWEEYEIGEITNITSLFCAFDNLEQCFECLYKWYNRPKYKELHGETDYVKACNILYQKGYATDSKYPLKLIKIIRDNNLSELYDTRVIDEKCKWFVQFEAFTNPTFAVRYAQRCFDNNIEVCIKEIKINGVTWFRIQGGAFVDRTRANAYAKLLYNKGYKNAYVTDEGGIDVTYKLMKGEK